MMWQLDRIHIKNVDLTRIETPNKVLYKYILSKKWEEERGGEMRDREVHGRDRSNYRRISHSPNRRKRVLTLFFRTSLSLNLNTYTTNWELEPRDEVSHVDPHLLSKNEFSLVVVWLGYQRIHTKIIYKIIRYLL